MNRFNSVIGAALIAALSWFSVAPALGQASYAKVQQPWFQQGKISGGISVTSSSAATALPTAGQIAWICNTGSIDAYLAFGSTNAVVATAVGSSWLKAGTCGNYDLVPFSTLYKFVAAITSTSTTTLTVETGIGTPPSQGGGGGGGAVTQGTTPWVTASGPAAVTTGAMQTSAVANGNGTVLSTTGLSSAALTVNCSACSGGTTVNFEGTQDGTNYSSLNAVQLGTNTLGQSTAASGISIWQMQIASLTNIRARISGYSAGTVTVTGQASPAVYPDKVTNLSSTSPGVTAYGQAAMAASIPVVVSSDQTGVAIKGVAGAVPVPFAFSTQYPINSVTTTPTPVTATATGTTAATAATLAATASVTNFVCGFTITADATALATGTATLSGTISGSMSYLQTIVAVTSGASQLTQNFSPCIPASAANTAITITSAAAGTGGNTIVNIWGYRL